MISQRIKDRKIHLIQTRVAAIYQVKGLVVKLNNLIGLMKKKRKSKKRELKERKNRSLHIEFKRSRLILKTWDSKALTNKKMKKKRSNLILRNSKPKRIRIEVVFNQWATPL